MHSLASKCLRKNVSEAKIGKPCTDNFISKSKDFKSCFGINYCFLNLFLITQKFGVRFNFVIDLIRP